MRIDDILNLPSMPITSPSYPRGPYKFVDREYLIITYESDPEAIRAALPEPLEPDGSNRVLYEFINMPDSTGFGKYTESGLVIPCKYKGEEMNFTSQMYLDCEPPISGGREVWGFPKKHGKPDLGIIHDTLTGTLIYADQQVAMGSMCYKQNNLLITTSDSYEHNVNKITKKLTKTQVNLKLIPDVDGTLVIAQLVAFNMCEINLKGAWGGQARLHLVPHVNAPVADLPVKKVIEGMHFIADLTLPYGRVLYNYLSK